MTAMAERERHVVDLTDPGTPLAWIYAVRIDEDHVAVQSQVVVASHGLVLTVDQARQLARALEEAAR